MVVKCTLGIINLCTYSMLELHSGVLIWVKSEEWGGKCIAVGSCGRGEVGSCGRGEVGSHGRGEVGSRGRG